MVAYNAAGTLARTLDRIPEEFRPRISEVIVSDDAGYDDFSMHGGFPTPRIDSISARVIGWR